MRGRVVPLSVLIASVATLVLSLVWVSSTGFGTGTGIRTGSGLGGPVGMMGQRPGEGRIDTIADAHRAVTRFADRWGLRTGEIMEFSNGYYAELVAEDGSLATEVLVDPPTGAVQFEFGPARMWNTAYGMMPGRGGTGVETVGPGEATAIANRWLREHRSGLHSGKAEKFPGYYTLHALRGERIVGMLSVNAASGAVWYHTWHGRFVRMDDSSDD